MLGQLIGLDQGAVGGTDEAAAAALHTSVHRQAVQRHGVFLIVGAGNLGGGQTEGTGIEARAATDAGSGLGELGLLFGQGQNGVGVLEDGGGGIGDGGLFPSSNIFVTESTPLKFSSNLVMTLSSANGIN